MSELLSLPVLVALIAVVVIGAVTLLGGTAEDKFSEVSSSLAG